jgi:outer membrane receptor for ferrienterochelin and colicin
LPVGTGASELFQIDTSVQRTPGTTNNSGSRVNGLGPEPQYDHGRNSRERRPRSLEAGFAGASIEIASMEAIRAVDIARAFLRAEYGRAMSGNINVVTKTGTNQWHGSLFHPSTRRN